jgi:hypothetical protein
MPGMPDKGAIDAMPSHHAMQSPPDICLTTSRSTSDVVLRLTAFKLHTGGRIDANAHGERGFFWIHTKPPSYSPTPD